MKPVRKCVFPVAGLGTRFLPATKATPKEMLPVVDKPLIQYAVEEAVAAGITELIFITGRGKRAIEDHFDRAYELESELSAGGKKKMLDEVRHMLPDGVGLAYVRQGEPRGLGHAVLCAKPLIGDEPFAVVLADDLIDAKTPVLKQMVDVYAKRRCSVLGVQEVPRDKTNQYGIVSGRAIAKGLTEVTGIIEKPKPEDAPSTIGVVGRYILTPGVLDQLENTPPGAGREIQLTDAIARLLDEESIYAYTFEGQRYDCGSKLGFLQATVDYGLKHQETGDGLRGYLNSLKL